MAGKFADDFDAVDSWKKNNIITFELNTDIVSIVRKSNSSNSIRCRVPTNFSEGFKVIYFDFCLTSSDYDFGLVIT